MAVPRTSPSVGLVELDRIDLIILDLSLSYLMDAERKNPNVLANNYEKTALIELHKHVLTLKRGTTN